MEQLVCFHTYTMGRRSTNATSLVTIPGVARLKSVMTMSTGDTVTVGVVLLHYSYENLQIVPSC